MSVVVYVARYKGKIVGDVVGKHRNKDIVDISRFLVRDSGFTFHLRRKFDELQRSLSAEKGLYDKYEVKNKKTGKVVTGTFVLRPDLDSHAWTALLAYANSVKDSNPVLYRDLLAWLR